ncbi:TPA: replication protein [Salmonella enterica subsp. enterica serovar Infantis]|uniref:Replication protein n=2 Tax=Salmonella enterica TaxID=28901 RepID=A0A749PGU1_SALER|nr:replication protein [Salmonella enterica]EAB5471928.1 replication protein [Salmonella enterica subsp. enterica serovar Typhisuis]EBW4770446.1 replication protein [Salmonella enterica subsp. enterica serovar Typhimurium]ECD7660132.1 replication protein [Salmonella enterica subsp. enterica serovar Newport]ECG8573497.1 replication protein [Salmonella enterica subsp. diarizonae]ECH9313459.1 replication protein [Salmonella enterica subsp. enterica]ESE82656.1 replication protein O of prophage CP
MANTAEVINFPVPDVAHKEPRVADLDDGFTRIANEILEAVMHAGLSQHQLLVFMAVMRKTYGFNKKSDWVSNEQLSVLTGILPHKCSSAKSALVKRGILTQTGRVIGINKTVSEWSSLPVKGTEKKPYLEKVNLPESGKKSLPESGNGYYPNQVNTKDTITKDSKDNSNKPPKPPRAVSFDASSVQLPDWLSSITWSSWVEYRRDLKKPIKSQQTVTQAINLLDRCRLNGYTPEEIINRSIANGWQGLFEPDGQAKRSRDTDQESIHWNSPDAWRDFL